MSRCRTSVAIASIAFLALTSCATYTVAADPRPGLWWSPALELKSLRELDARLAAPFPDAVDMARDRDVV